MFFRAGAMSATQSADTFRLSATGKPEVHVGAVSAKPEASHGFGSKIAFLPKFGNVRMSRYVCSLVEPSWLTVLSERPVVSDMSHEWLPLGKSPSRPSVKLIVVVVLVVERPAPRASRIQSGSRLIQTMSSLPGPRVAIWFWHAASPAS